MRLNDQIDRAILQMKPPAVRKPGNLGLPFHGRDPGNGCGGAT
jgi:hypothetical protein